jgi:hypothetical protein
MFKEIFIDVSELEAPEPYTQIINLISELGEDNYIRVKHRMEPFPLYDLLHESGYDYATIETKRENEHTDFNILIWQSKNKELSQYCQHLKMIK